MKIPKTRIICIKTNKTLKYYPQHKVWGIFWEDYAWVDSCGLAGQAARDKNVLVCGEENK